MTTVDIEAIRYRAEKFEAVCKEISPSNYRIIVTAARSAGDVPVLLAEIERLVAENKKLSEWNTEIKDERDDLAKRLLGGEHG